MGDLTKNLSRHEFACKCGCGFDTADFELVNALQLAVNYFADRYIEQIRIDITGPNRCREHNETVQFEYNEYYVPYTSQSQHLYGRAVDHKISIRKTGRQIDPDEVADYYEDVYRWKYGLGRYNNRTHLDTRIGDPKRW